MSISLIYAAAARLRRGAGGRLQRAAAARRITEGPVRLPRLHFLTYSLSLSLRPNPLEALFARDSHALSKTIRSEAEKRESREWRARERVREIADGVALLKDMAEARCVVVLLALDALIWSGLALLSHPLSIPNMCGCGVLFHTISTNQTLAHSTSGSD